MGRNRVANGCRTRNRRSHRRFTLIGGVVVLALLVSGCDWAQVGFGPDHRFYNPHEPAITESAVAKLQTAWSKPCSCGRALATGGTVYVVDGSTLRAFNAATGDTRWSTPIGSDFTLGAVLNGLVYLTHRPPSGPQQLVTRDAATGAARFSFTPSAIANQMVTIGDVIVDGPLAFVAGTSGSSTTVYAVDTAGAVVWADTPGGYGFTLVADPGKTVYIGTSIIIQPEPGIGRELPLLTGYRQTDGAVASTAVVDVARGGSTAIAYANGLVYTYSTFAFGGTGVGMSAVDAATGEVKWGHASYPVAVAPNAVISNFQAEWLASDPATGAPLWSRTELPPTGGPGLAVGRLFLRGTADTLVAHRLADGTIAGSFTPAAGEPIRDLITAGGQVLVVTTAHLVAVKPPT